MERSLVVFHLSMRLQLLVNTLNNCILAQPTYVTSVYPALGISHPAPTEFDYDSPLDVTKAVLPPKSINLKRKSLQIRKIAAYIEL